MSDTSLVPTPGHTSARSSATAAVRRRRHLAAPHQPAAVRLHGVVSDGNGDPIPDALIEIWQADEAGQCRSAPARCAATPTRTTSAAYFLDTYTFTGFGRAAVDNAGEYAFQTLLPGPTEPGRPHSSA